MIYDIYTSCLVVKQSGLLCHPVVGTIPEGNPCGGFICVTIDPNGAETDEPNNTLRKFVSFRNHDGYASIVGSSSMYIGFACPAYGDRTPTYDNVNIVIHNCSAAPVSRTGIVHVRQSREDFDREVPHEVYVSACSGDVAPDRRVNPIFLRVNAVSSTSIRGETSERFTAPGLLLLMESCAVGHP